MFGMGNFPDMYNLVVKHEFRISTTILNSPEDAQKKRLGKTSFRF